jgi:peptidoglycan-binding protein ArfA
MSSPSLPAYRRPRYGVLAVSLLLAWVTLSLLAFGLRRGPIQHDLSRRSGAALRRAGVTGASVTYRGRDATLHGTFAGATQAARARDLVARVDGTRAVALGDQVQAARPAPAGPVRPFVVTLDAGGLTVTAAVPDEASRRALLVAAADASGGTLVARVTVSAGVSAPAAGTVEAVARALTRAAGPAGPPTGLRATVGAGVLRLDGTVATAAARAAVDAAARAALPGTGIDDQVAVADPGAARRRVLAAIAAGPVTFASGSADLTAADRARLAGVAAAMRTGDVGVRLTGNTDATGPAEVNRALAAARAEAAAAWLRARGIGADRLRTAGLGATRPLASNATPGGRAANRRVDLTLLGS